MSVNIPSHTLHKRDNGYLYFCFDCKGDYKSKSEELVSIHLSLQDKQSIQNACYGRDSKNIESAKSMLEDRLKELEESDCKDKIKVQFQNTINAYLLSLKTAESLSQKN